MKRMIVLLSGALALVSLASVSTAEAQSVERFRSSDTRITGFFGVNVCCEAHIVDLDGPDEIDFDLDPAIGFGLRVERKVADWLAIGGMFEFVAAKADGVDDRFFFIDADIFGKVLYELQLSSSMGLELYGLIPFGFTAGIDGDETFGDEVRAFGLNTGLMAGAMLLLQHFGIVFEMGMRHHSVWDEADFGVLGNRDVRLGVNQFALNFGVSVTF
ncbi:MAG: hypothetical protein JJ863_07125 [Deltaproteobacteria bacterium]|nr:hypothetical protein [Deltaproteobacteria bacterium]